MNELQLRLELQGAVQNYVEQLLYQNGVPAHLIEDAFTKALVYIKNKTVQEFIISASAKTPPTEKEEVKDGDE